MPHPALLHTAHRPYPPPRTPWLMRMTWRHLLFIHWPVPVDTLRPHVPDHLDIDTFDDTAWLGVISFLMTGVRARCAPPVPTTHAFPELNVRTYVTPTRAADRLPGVWFFSLDAASPLAVAAARRTFHLEYLNADMACTRNMSTTTYTCTRTHRGAPPARFEATYAPRGPAAPSEPGTLEHFLTERYCLYALAPASRLIRAHIHHAPWRLADAHADISRCDMTALLGVPTPASSPHLRLADDLDVVAWGPRRVR